ncbi:MAG: BlaI/MecI/CopY family transcriptional regulator [Clostridia bacterium]|nr:BlaI/MecI/CopY family transcriptional regulator [Clostridia bacterium]
MIKLSDCEIYIMHVIWTNEETTSFDILDKVKEDKKLSEKTVRTLLARMVKKKAIYISSKTGKTYTYKPLIDKNEFLRVEIDKFLEIHQMSKEELMWRLNK